MGEAALALAQDIQPMVVIARHDHLGFPGSRFSSRVRRFRAPCSTCLVLDALAGRSSRLLGPSLSMVTRERAKYVLSATIDVLINRFVAHGGPGARRSMLGSSQFSLDRAQTPGPAST